MGRLLLPLAAIAGLSITPVHARDYLGTSSREYRLVGKTVVAVTQATVRRLGEARAVAQALEDDNRYYNLIHFISSYFVNHRFSSFCRGGSFRTSGLRSMADGRYEVTFEGEMAGPLDLVERMQRRNLMRGDRRFVVPMPADVDGMPEHDWYYFKPDAFEGELVQVPLTIEAEEPAADAYPDYGRLFADGVLSIAVFYGYDGGDDEEGLPGGNDLAVAEEFYRTITDEARRHSFGDPIDERFGRIRASTTFTKSIIAQQGPEARPVEVQLKIFYRKTPRVKWRFREALKTADVVIYDGHSSYGGGFSLSPTLYFSNPEDTVALDREMRREPRPERYQIYFVNACHSYGYYADMFYDLLSTKDPTNLDVVSTINAASYADAVKTDVKMVDALTRLQPGTRRLLHRPLSWKEIVGDLNRGLECVTHYAVHGIGDNPRVAYGPPATRMAAASGYMGTAGATDLAGNPAFWPKVSSPRGGRRLLGPVSSVPAGTPPD